MMWFHAFRNSFMILDLKKLAMQYLPDTARDMYIDLPARTVIVLTFLFACWYAYFHVHVVLMVPHCFMFAL